jgi:CheY-like chemotaxis protein
MKSLVLLVDDDRLAVPLYKEALEVKGFAVKQCFDADSALSFVRDKKSEIGVIVLDIMIPPGKTYENLDTGEGLKTGVFLYDTLRQILPDVPIIVLTNVTEDETLNEFRQRGVNFWQKASLLPSRLVKLVSKAVGS